MRKHSLTRLFLGTLATAGAMAGLAAAMLNPPDFILQQAARPAPARAEWLDIVKPFQLFAVASAAFGAEPHKFTARRHIAGGGRTDSLIYGGDNPGSGHWLHVEIYRFGREYWGATPLYADLARVAARTGGSIARAAMPGRLETRFGEMEVVEIQFEAESRFTTCTGFRLSRRDPGLSISGIACGTPARPLDRMTLACTLERLDLIGSGEDRPIGAFFAASELRRRQDCLSPRTAQPLDRPDWLNPAARTLPLKRSAQAFPGNAAPDAR